MKFINKIATGIFASLLFTGITTVNAMKRWANNTISIKHQSHHKKRKLTHPREECYATPHKGLFADKIF